MSTLVTPGRAFAAAAIVVASTLAGSVAHSYFLAPAGGGIGHGRTATFDGVSVEAEAGRTDATLLLPGVAGDIVVRLTNTNVAPVRVSGFRPATSPAAVSVDDDHADCEVANLALNLGVDLDGNFVGAPADTFLAGGEHKIVRLAGAVTLSPDAPDACQGATFTIPVTVTAEVTR